MQFPQKSASREEITPRITDAISRDANWRGGKIFSLVYFAGDDVADQAPSRALRSSSQR